MNRICLATFLCILALLAVPASAYTLMNQYDLGDAMSTGTASPASVDYDSLFNLTNITHIEWSGVCRPNSTEFLNSFTDVIVQLKYSSSPYFEGNLSYTIGSGAEIGKYYPCGLTYNLIKTGSGTANDPVVYYYGNATSVFSSPYSKLFINKSSVALPDAPWIQFYSSTVRAGGIYKLFTGTAMAVPVADFSGTPRSGRAPQLISLTDNSTGGSLTYNWSGSGPGTMWWGPVTTQNTSVYLSTPGNYTITHGVENAMGSDIETKTDYIWIYDDNATVTTEFVTIDAIGGAAILNASVSLRDVENSSWTNSSTNAMGSAYITTLVGHTINAYASAIGFKDNDLLGVEAAGPPQGYAILMQPKGYFNVSSGYVTLYVSVFDDGTSEPISGASVTVAKSNGMAELWQTTNAAGIATFPVENETDFIAQASKAGYSTASKGVNSGTGSGGDATVSVNIWLAKGTVTPTTTMTAVPGGTVPVTQDPYLSLSSEEKQSALATDVMNYGPMLVNFFILLTIVGGFKMITK